MCFLCKTSERFAEPDKHRREVRIHDALRTGSVCEWHRSKELKRYTNESNASLDVLVIIPEDADGLSKSRETEDTTGIELNGCLSNTGVRGIDEVLESCQQARQTSTRTLEVCY